MMAEEIPSPDNQDQEEKKAKRLSNLKSSINPTTIDRLEKVGLEDKNLEFYPA